jgi:RNA polymerase sigma factor, sigma-70 family
MTKRDTLSSMQFDLIVREYHTMVFRVVLGFVRQREDAEDLTQDVFVSAYKNIEEFRGEAEMSTWLYRIAINLSLNFMDRKKRRDLLQAGESMLKSLFRIADNTKNPQKVLETEEEERRIQKAISSLPQKQQIAFILTRINDLPQKEVAKMMNISQRAVEQLLLRGKNNLNKKLGIAIRKCKPE